VRDLPSRFWSKVQKGEPNSCWEWQAATNTAGYGWFSIATAKPKSAHRVAAWLSKILPAIESDLHVLHKCDNRKCCNPEHLFVGTNSDNVADRVQKGRGGFKRMHGETNGMSKLTNKVIGEMRGLYFSTCLSQSELAKRFNTTQSHVSRIVNKVRRGVVS
jgi:hypothetical protein